MNGKDKGYMKLLRMYMQAIKMYFADGPVVAASEAAGETAVAEYSHTAVAVCSENPNIKHIPKRTRLGYEYESTKRGVIQNWKRRRLLGGGRNRLVSHVRDGLFMWYSIVRHSVDVKIMCRFPKLAFKLKAQSLYQEYIISSLHKGIQPETVTINDRWVNDWLVEHRLTQRQPNRKWKVSRPVLMERLKIFWRMIYKLRKLVQLAKGYDPKMRNFDQSPFHLNEAGSQVTGSITMKGTPIIPLLETTETRGSGGASIPWRIRARSELKAESYRALRRCSKQPGT